MTKFAAINEFGEVVSIHHTYDEARFYIGDLIGNFKVMPIMTLADYMATSTDFRGLLRGQPSILYYNRGTTLGHVYLIESWDALQHQASRDELYKRYEEFIKMS